MSQHGQNRSNLAILPEMASNEIKKRKYEDKCIRILILGKKLICVKFSGSLLRLFEI